MSVRYRIHRNLQIVHTVVSETTDARELHAYSQSIRMDPEFGSDFDHVIELAEGHSGSDEMLAAQVFSHLVPPVFHVKVAVVAPGNQQFDLARRFQSIGELPTEVFSLFRNLEDALAWLGLDGDLVGWGDWKNVPSPG